jgi:non-ribosomal peptide synthetase component F
MAHNPTFRELIEQVYQGELDAYSHQNVPLRALLHDGVIGDGNQLPTRVLFNMLGVPKVSMDLEGLTHRHVNVGVGDDGVLSELITVMRPHNLDLYQMIREEDGKLRGLWLYQPERIHPRDMGVLIRQWPAALKLVVDHLDSGVAQLRDQLRQMVLPADGAPTGA